VGIKEAAEQSSAAWLLLLLWENEDKLAAIAPENDGFNALSIQPEVTVSVPYFEDGRIALSSVDRFHRYIHPPAVYLITVL
jgi:hypothetical protein